jgi:hypothetical protein
MPEKLLSIDQKAAVAFIACREATEDRYTFAWEHALSHMEQLVMESVQNGNPFCFPLGDEIKQLALEGADPYFPLSFIFVFNDTHTGVRIIPFPAERMMITEKTPLIRDQQKLQANPGAYAMADAVGRVVVHDIQTYEHSPVMVHPTFGEDDTFQGYAVGHVSEEIKMNIGLYTWIERTKYELNTIEHQQELIRGSSHQSFSTS